MNRSTTLALALSVSLLGCGGGGGGADTGPGDGAPDVAVMDSGADSATPDATADTGIGVVDGGADGGPPDGAADAGPADTGPPVDAGVVPDGLCSDLCSKAGACIADPMPMAECVAGCGTDLTDCTMPQIGAIEACLAMECSPLLECIQTVSCVGG